MSNSIGIGIGMGIGGVGGGSLPAEIEVNAVHFDGSNDVLKRGAGLTGAVDNKFALYSFWFNLKGGDGSNRTFIRASGSFNTINRDPTNLITVFFGDVDVVLLYSGTTTTTFVAAGGWVHFLLSVDTTTDSSQRVVYINDVLETMTAESKNAGDIDWTRTDWGIGAQPEDSTRKIDADVAEYYMTNEFLDLTNVNNRRKFISDAGKPVDLGVDGSTPTGTQPLIYLSGPTVDWHTNKGTGEGFTETGELTDATDSPSD